MLTSAALYIEILRSTKIVEETWKKRNKIKTKSDFIFFRVSCFHFYFFCIMIEGTSSLFIYEHYIWLIKLLLFKLQGIYSLYIAALFPVVFWAIMCRFSSLVIFLFLQLRINWPEKHVYSSENFCITDKDNVLDIWN